ncbi:MAG TPA: alkaline phosphatase family protein [Planctomycetota bacterium]|nr:alkaline phosphatase family protein [Planctomycetota bacterium]
MPISRRTALKGLGAAVSIPLLERIAWADPGVMAAAAAPLPTPDHIVIVVEENRAAGEIIGSTAAPYINSLVTQGAYFSQSYAITHPSQPNYLALFSGSTQGITDDSTPHTFTTPNLGAALSAKGRTFAGYSEDLPGVGSTVGTTTSGYARKHAPWVNWQGSATNGLPTGCNQPLTAFPAAFASLPTVSYVIPNLKNDMHDGTVATADAWLQTHLDAYIQWAKTHNSLFILTWDEDDHSDGNRIATIIVGARVLVGTYAERIDHYRLLRTIENMYDLAHSKATTTATPISACWTSTPVITTQPQAKAVISGQPATFTVVATGVPAPTYQWQRNGVNIAKANAASYTTPATTSSDNGATFRCVVINSAGSVTSTAVLLTVTATPVVGSGTGLSGAYFDGQNLTGPVVLRTDPAVDFTWAATAAPISGIAAGTYSVRWSGRVQAPLSQAYTFLVTADDGVRLWVNGQKLVDQWNDHGPTEYSGTITLTAGSYYDLVLEYYQAGGGARIALAWAGAATPKQLIPMQQLYPSGVSAPWSALDLGTGTLTGGGYVAEDTVVLSGAGGDIWNAADAGRFISQSLSGDGTIVARVVSLQDFNPWAKAGVMIREGTAAGARHAFCCLTPGNGVGFIRRTAINATSAYTAGSRSAVPRWVRLVRAAALITGAESADGVTWATVGSVSLALTNPVRIGLALTSGDNSRLCTGVFDLVQITPSASG